MAKRKLENKTIEIILLVSDKHLGEKYQTVRVKPIFARNVLLPKKMAVIATSENVNQYGQKIKAAANDRAKQAKSFEDLLAKIQADGGLKITRKANDEKTLYDKINEEDLAKVIAETYSIEIQPHRLKLKKKIVSAGTYSVPFIYQDLKKDIDVTVIAELTKKWSKKAAEAEKAAGEEEVKEEKKLTREEIKALKDAERAKKKEETLKSLKKKYK